MASSAPIYYNCNGQPTQLVGETTRAGALRGRAVRGRALDRGLDAWRVDRRRAGPSGAWTEWCVDQRCLDRRRLVVGGHGPSGAWTSGAWTSGAWTGGAWTSGEYMDDPSTPSNFQTAFYGSHPKHGKKIKGEVSDPKPAKPSK